MFPVGGGTMIKHAPRLLIAGTGSGCGKTTIVCAILQALKNRGHDIASFKCGPDYIDSMFHSEIIGAQSTNIDLFFSDEAQARSIFVKHAAELNIIEGVMGFYDGMSMDSENAFVMEERPVNPYSEETEMGAVDAVHPGAAGYYQIADTIYSTMCGTMENWK